MFRLSCCEKRSPVDALWMIGGSLLLVGVGVLLDKLGGTATYGEALIYSAFPIALLMAETRLHPEKWPRLISFSVLVYGLTLAMTRL